MKVYTERSLPKNSDNCCVNTQIKEVSAEETNLNIKFFKMNPDGRSPLHSHPQRHHLIITDSKGTVFNGKETTTIQAGDIVYILPNEPHQIKAVGQKPLKFICLTL